MLGAMHRSSWICAALLSWATGCQGAMMVADAPDAGCASCEDAAAPPAPADAAIGEDAYVPPGDAAIDAGAPADAASPQACELGPDAPLILLYGSVGREDNLRFLSDDCSAELVVGEKRDTGPGSVMRRPEVRAAGGRSGYVMDLFGERIRDALRRDNGVARTAEELRAILATGYDYIVIDEITAAADWADGSLVNRRFQALLEELPPRTIIAYVSLDLTMVADDGAGMHARRQLFDALMRYGRAIALEVYLHTGQVMAGQAPDTLRRAAIRLRESVLGLPGGGHINERAITVLGASINQPLAQYNYLDRPSQDLSSIRTQARAVRSYGALLTEQRGLGYYFVNHSDLEPRDGAPYDFDRLIDVMSEEALLTARGAE